MVLNWLPKSVRYGTRTRRDCSKLATQVSARWEKDIATQPEINPGSVVTPLALRYSALDHCATQEAPKVNLVKTPLTAIKVVNHFE